MKSLQTNTDNYGTIEFVNADTNYMGNAVVKSFDNSRFGSFSEYVFDLRENKLVFENESKSTALSYFSLVDLINTASATDRKTIFVKRYSFYFDVERKPHLKDIGIIKSAFPLPDKSILYGRKYKYINITEHLLGKSLVSVLEASVVCDALNNIAVSGGVVGDRAFEHSCGRIFVNKGVINTFAEFCSKFKSLKPKSVLENHTYKNNFLKIHTKCVSRLYGKNIFTIMKHPSYILEVINYEMLLIRREITKVYKSFRNMSPKDFEYLTIDELLNMYWDVDFAYGVSKYVTDVKKVFNGNKHRNIVYIMSDGTVVEK